MARRAKQPIDMPLLKGMDQSIDSRLGPPGSMLQLRNCHFDKAGRLVKRPRFQATTISAQGTTVSGTVRRLTSRKNVSVFCLADNLYEYTANSGYFSTSRGSLPQCGAPVRTPIAQDADFEHTHSGVAVYNSAGTNYFVYAWIKATSATTGCGQLWSEIRDQNGVVLRKLEIDVLTGTLTKLRLLSFGSKIVAVWLAGTSAASNDIGLAYLDFGSGVPTSWTSGGTLDTATNTNYLMDAYATSGAMFVAYRTTTTNLRVKRLDTSIAVTHTANLTTTANIDEALGIFADSSRVVCAYAAGSNTRCQMRSATDLSSVLTETNVFPGTAIDPDQVTVINDPSLSTRYLIYAHRQSNQSGTGNFIPNMRKTLVTSSGTVTESTQTTYGTLLASRILVYDSRWYGVLHVPNTGNFANQIARQEGAYYLCELFSNAHPRMVCVLANGGLGSDNLHETTAYLKASLNDFALVTTGQYQIALPEVLVFKASKFSAAATWDPVSSGAQEGTVAYTVDFLDSRAALPVELGDSLYFSGGVVMQYDGSIVSELGFAHSPRFAENFAGEGGAGAKTYQYTFTYGWRDNSGLYHESAPGAGQERASVAGAASSVDVSTIQLTQKAGSTFSATNNPIVIRVWRTKDGGSTFFLAGEATNSMSAELVTVSNLITIDATLELNQVLYVEGGVITNAQPDAASDVCVWQNRLCASKGNFVRFTNEWSADIAPQFTEGFSHTVQIGAAGSITAIETLDDTLVAFRKQEIYLAGGELPSPTGVPTLAPARVLTSDVGCYEPRSVVATRLGLMFQSFQGLSLLPRGFGPVQWIGEPVRDETDDETITAACAVPGDSLVLFAISDAILCFDINRGAWTTWDPPADSDGVGTYGIAIVKTAVTSQTATTIAMCNGASPNPTLYLGTVGAATDTEAGWTDSHVVTTVESHDWPISGNSTGYARAYALRIKGEASGLCRMTLEESYNEGAYQTAKTWDLSATGRFVKEYVLKYPNANSVQFRIKDAARSGASGTAGITLNSLTLDVVVRGSDPRPAADRK